MSDSGTKDGRERPGAAGGSSEPSDLSHLLVERIRDYAIFALDPSGHVKSWNRGAERIKGYTAEEIVGRHFSTFYPAEDVAAGRPGYGLMIAEAEGSYSDEGWRIRKDGSRFWANVLITALREDDGTLLGFAKITRDLTVPHRTREALRQSEERFSLLVQTVKDYAIFILDTSGRIVSWNRGAEAIKGYTAEEIIGRHFSVLYTSEDLAAGKPAVEIDTATADGRFESEGWRVRKDGTLFWADVTMTALRDEQGELVGFVKVTRDLTERRASQQRAIADARRLAEAEAASRAKSEFLAAMSHELRTPLNAIGGYADLLKLGVYTPLAPDQLKAVERIQRSQRHLLGIINDLLNFSRVEAGQVTYEVESVDVDDALDEIRPMIEPQAAAGHVDLEWPRRGSGLVLRADPQKLEQILLNLLTNAVKFTPSGGRISVLASEHEDGERVQIEVHDTGVGIPTAMLETIFEPFVQVGRTLDRPREGAGLGLAISRDLARAMGGDLIASSKPGAGSTFTLLMPKAG